MTTVADAREAGFDLYSHADVKDDAVLTHIEFDRDGDRRIIFARVNIGRHGAVVLLEPRHMNYKGKEWQAAALHASYDAMQECYLSRLGLTLEPLKGYVSRASQCPTQVLIYCLSDGSKR